MPEFLPILAIVSLAVAALCCLAILADIFLFGHRQHMWIMDAVWPLTALFAGPLALWAYSKIGRLSTERNVRQAKQHGEKPLGQKKPFWESVGVGATHCGSGCTLGDIVAEWFIFFVPSPCSVKPFSRPGWWTISRLFYSASPSSISPSSPCGTCRRDRD
jgi:hypothetical protein